jgi:uncharacterized metal-binding protein
MAVDCASCDRYACQVGRLDATPDDCPMRGPFPSFEELYATDESRRLLYHSARVEAEGYGRWTRLREVAELARRMEYRRLGVASCPDMGLEADLAARSLRRLGLDVIVAAPFADCDPVAQAALLAEERTHLNVIAGMCVGHDTLFIRHSRAPVTSLVVRDPRLAHNPAAALYTRDGYLKKALYGVREPPLPGRFAGWSDELIDGLAREVRDAGLGRETPPCRIEEVLDFARRAGVTHLGIVHCVGFRREARDLAAILGTNGFRVSSSCCKTGSVPKATLGIRDEEQVTPGRPEMTCNPVAQAALLEREGAELALLMGQCVGHDSATMSRLHVPAVCVVAKDRVLAHNTVAALYRS